MNKEMQKLLRAALYVFSFVLLGLLFGVLTFKVLSFSRTVQMPDLSGKSIVEANRLMTDKGLYLNIEGEDFDASVPQGNIIRQDVPAGNKVKERRGVKVVISKGPRVSSVPMLVNSSLTDAETSLLQKGLKIGKVIMVHSDVVEKDVIIAQKPDVNDHVSDTVTVLVSQGPYEAIYYCPDFKDMPMEQVGILIKKLGLKAVVSGTGETVEAQKPEAGKQIKSGETIYLKLH